MIASVIKWFSGDDKEEDEEEQKKQKREQGDHALTFASIPPGFEIRHGELQLEDEVLGTGGFTAVFVGRYRNERCAVKVAAFFLLCSLP
jgi:hypothetical protein